MHITHSPAAGRAPQKRLYGATPSLARTAAHTRLPKSVRFKLYHNTLLAAPIQATHHKGCLYVATAALACTGAHAFAKSARVQNSHDTLPILLFAPLQATHHKERLYVATGEYWGYDYIRMPSIYWSIIKTAGSLCELTRTDHGIIASRDGLALAYPVIAAREDGGALVAFSYSGKGFVAGGGYPAYPGACVWLPAGLSRDLSMHCWHGRAVQQGNTLMLGTACHLRNTTLQGNIAELSLPYLSANSSGRVLATLRQHIVQ